MKIWLIAFIFSVSAIASSACKKFNGRTENFDPTTVSYQLMILPLMEEHCVGCHDASSELPLNDYAHLVEVSKSGRLKGALTKGVGYRSMPESGDSLSEEQIQLFLTWISQEYPE